MPPPRSSQPARSQPNTSFPPPTTITPLLPPRHTYRRMSANRSSCTRAFSRSPRPHAGSWQAGSATRPPGNGNGTGGDDHRHALVKTTKTAPAAGSPVNRPATVVPVVKPAVTPAKPAPPQVTEVTTDTTALPTSATAPAPASTSSTPVTPATDPTGGTPAAPSETTTTTPATATDTTTPTTTPRRRRPKRLRRQRRATPPPTTTTPAEAAPATSAPAELQAPGLIRSAARPRPAGPGRRARSAGGPGQSRRWSAERERLQRLFEHAGRAHEQR